MHWQSRWAVAAEDRRLTSGTVLPLVRSIALATGGAQFALASCLLHVEGLPYTCLAAAAWRGLQYLSCQCASSVSAAAHPFAACGQ